MRHVERIDGVKHGADEEAGHIERGWILRAETDHQSAGANTKETGRNHHQTTVHTVRNTADRHLGERTTGKEGGKQRGALRRAHADGLRINPA